MIFSRIWYWILSSLLHRLPSCIPLFPPLLFFGGRKNPASLGSTLDGSTSQARAVESSLSWSPEDLGAHAARSSHSSRLGGFYGCSLFARDKKLNDMKVSCTHFSGNTQPTKILVTTVYLALTMCRAPCGPSRRTSMTSSQWGANGLGMTILFSQMEWS